MSDRSTYAPFILLTDRSPSLILTPPGMEAKETIFASFEGRQGNGYDWSSVAECIIFERLPELATVIQFDPEADTFSAHGPVEALQRLGGELRDAYHDDARLRDLLSRAQRD